MVYKYREDSRPSKTQNGRLLIIHEVHVDVNLPDSGFFRGGEL
jgi:hypothetical protein